MPKIRARPGTKGHQGGKPRVPSKRHKNKNKNKEKEVKKETYRQIINKEAQGLLWTPPDPSLGAQGTTDRGEQID